MKRTIIFTAILILSLVVIVDSCTHGGESKVSRYGDTESHNMGQNCMNCHKMKGEGEGWFNVASTVYRSDLVSTYPNRTVHLYTGPNGSGTLKYILEVDGNGNFYTTEAINFGSGLFPAVTSDNGTKYMSTAITIGSCASCHGATTDRIWAE